jgi:poly(3-hydroxybutyrate) depolymerase
MGSAVVGGQRLALVFLAWLGSAAAAADCDPAEKMTGDGPFAVEFFNETLNGTIFYGWLPVSNAPAPVVAFMHGSTGQWGFYSENLRIYASHGLAVVFPFIESPEGDEHWSVWKSNLRPDFDVRVCDSFDGSSSAVLRELDESNRFVPKSAESTSI